ncbi:MAG TPA: alpha/beta hydrolase [Sphingomicrobium sp.]|nr:alpha/beta hydrolase [Sphingomicrobium sp.]
MLVRLLLALLIAMPAAAAAQAPTAKGHIDTAPGVSIYYERYGTGPKLVLIPGRLFMPEFARLARPDRTVVQYDMRNRGLSKRVEDTGQITIMGDVADVEALRRHFGAEKVSLIGYSYLGLMVALYATEHPDRVERLIQIGPVPRKFPTAYPADQQAGSESLSAEGKAAEAAWNAMRSKLDTADPKEACATLQRYVGYQLVGNPANHVKVPDSCVYENESIANFGRHLTAHFGDIQKRDFPREPFTKLEQPVLTLHGTLDRNAPYGSGLEWATTFRHGRLITVEGGAHQLWLDDPSVLADIDRFLAGDWPARAQRFGRE